MNHKLQMSTLISIKDEIKEKQMENKILTKFKKITPKIDKLSEQIEIIANQGINEGNQLMIAVNENFNRMAETLNMMQIQTMNECQKQLLIPVQNCFAAFRTLSDQLPKNFQTTFKNQNNMLFMLCHNLVKSSNIEIVLKMIVDDLNGIRRRNSTNQARLMVEKSSQSWSIPEIRPQTPEDMSVKQLGNDIKEFVDIKINELKETITESNPRNGENSTMQTIRKNKRNFPSSSSSSSSDEDGGNANPKLIPIREPKEYILTYPNPNINRFSGQELIDGKRDDGL
jgi:DNA-binding ferritin-like protein (Dps family)